MSKNGFLLLGLLWVLISIQKSRANDDLYILIDEISVFSCKGIKNQIRLGENDVNIVNGKGNRVYYIKAPGNYSLHFNKIQVSKEFGYLTGEIGVTLQVPILEGPAGIRFDVPYTMIPETGLIDQHCDEYSGIVQRGNQQYCRYCELCGLSGKIEKGLNQGRHKFLPELAAGDEDAFAPHCGKIESDTYEFKRTIQLPGKKELENMIKGKVQGVDDEIKKRLNKGRGRFQVFLNLISAKRQPLSQRAWFQGSEKCKACLQSRDSLLSSFLDSCDIEACKSVWAQQCLHNSAEIVGCYTVEFNYRMTDKYFDVQRFLRENNYPNQEVATEPPPTTTPPPPPLPDGVAELQDLSARCVAQMPAKNAHLRRYCTIFWNAKLCCNSCPSVCSPSRL
ncbi:hypothetical protein FO519_002956 [Halicephalobus sp. NKZ332]|nr:hypothetical protein FO519_002956 [Halicephalobus sp. NKZ332]